LTLLDASALLTLLLGQPGEPEVSELLRQGNCTVPAPCLTEVVDQLIRKHRVDPGAVSERLGPLIDETIPIASTDPRIAWQAGEVRAAHYDRKTAALSLADCVLLATAGPDDEIASSDATVIATAGKLGIGVVPLPDSKGRRPTV
jgi:PIN domain nuclease of toxin-antitoxin system